MQGPILYIGGSLPTLSETFVSGEVLGLRARGFDIPTASVHEPDGTLAEPELQEMARASIRIYGGRPLAVVPDALLELMRAPVRGLGVMLGAARDALVEPDVPGAKKGKVLWQAVAGLALARRIRGLGVAHIHAHMAHVQTTIAMYAARQAGVGFSFTGHAVDLFKERTLLNAKLRRARFVACISEWHRAFYAEQVAGVADRAPIVRCGVEIPPARETQILRDQTRPPRLLAVGRLVKKKGFDVLLRAVGVLRDAGVLVDCTVIGDGPERAALESLVEAERLGESIRFAGSVPNESVRTAMRLADVFVLPCRVSPDGDRDGIPVVLMEAMASGACAVSGDLPTIRELVRDGQTGVMVPPDDAGALASALRRLIDDPASARRLAREGRAWVEQEFSREANLDRLVAAFDRHAGIQGPAGLADKPGGAAARQESVGVTP